MTLETLTTERFDVRGYKRGYIEEGTITTPLDMRARNDLDGFHLVLDGVDRLPDRGSQGACLKQQIQDKLIEPKHYINQHMPKSASASLLASFPGKANANKL